MKSPLLVFFGTNKAESKLADRNIEATFKIYTPQKESVSDLQDWLKQDY